MATACNGFPRKDPAQRQTTRDALGALGLDVAALEDTARLLTGPTSETLQLDIFGEYVLTREWDKPEHSHAWDEVCQRLFCAAQLNPDGLAVILARTTIDFPEGNLPLRWRQELAKNLAGAIPASTAALFSFNNDLLQGDGERAEGHLDFLKALLRMYPEEERIRSNLSEAWSWKGVFLANQGRSEEAIAAFRQGIELGDGDAAFNLGMLLAKQGRSKEALAACRQGIELGDGKAASTLGGGCLPSRGAARRPKKRIKKPWMPRRTPLIKMASVDGYLQSP